MSAPRYTLDGEPVDLDGFLDDNLDDLTCDQYAQARDLRPGQSFTLGGGATPIVVLACFNTPLIDPPTWITHPEIPCDKCGAPSASPPNFPARCATHLHDYCVESDGG